MENYSLLKDVKNLQTIEDENKLKQLIVVYSLQLTSCSPQDVEDIELLIKVCQKKLNENSIKQNKPISEYCNIDYSDVDNIMDELVRVNESSPTN